MAKIILEIKNGMTSDDLHDQVEKLGKNNKIEVLDHAERRWNSYDETCKNWFKKEKHGRLIPPAGLTQIIKRDGRYKAFNYVYTNETKWHKTLEEAKKELNQMTERIHSNHKGGEQK